MIYRRVIPIAAAGAIAVAAGLYTLSKSNTGSRINNIVSTSGYHGLDNYTFVDSKKYELLNATVFLRHGARTPNYFVDSKFEMPDWECDRCYVDMLPELSYDTDVKEIPSMKLIDEDIIMDDYIEHLKGKCTWGQLTLVGQKQSLALGKELRRIYMDGYKILKNEFSENEIYCRSTKFPRTFYSLKGVLAGIYGIRSFDRCHRPIIHTMAIETDTLYPNTHLCSVMSKFMVSGAAEIAKDDEIIKMKCFLRESLGVDNLTFYSPDKRTAREQKSCDNIKQQPLKINDSTTVSTPPEQNVTIYAVRDDFVSRQVHGFPVPSNFSSMLPEINRLSSEEVLYEHLGGAVEWEDRILLLVSPAINILKDNMKMILEKTEVKSKDCMTDMRQSLTRQKVSMKMQIISCHDTTLIPMLVCLRIYDGQWPTFTANIIVELYKERRTGDLFTRLVYNGKTQNINMSQGEPCNIDNEYSRIGLSPYKDFIKFLDTYSFSDDKYISACDKALKLFTSGKPISKDQFI